MFRLLLTSMHAPSRWRVAVWFTCEGLEHQSRSNVLVGEQPDASRRGAAGCRESLMAAAHPPHPSRSLSRRFNHWRM